MTHQATQALKAAIVRIDAAGDPARLTGDEHAKFIQDCSTVQSWCSIDGLRKLLTALGSAAEPVASDDFALQLKQAENKGFAEGREWQIAHALAAPPATQAACEPVPFCLRVSHATVPSAQLQAEATDAQCDAIIRPIYGSCGTEQERHLVRAAIAASHSRKPGEGGALDRDVAIDTWHKHCDKFSSVLGAAPASPVIDAMLDFARAAVAAPSEGTVADPVSEVEVVQTGPGRYRVDWHALDAAFILPPGKHLLYTRVPAPEEAARWLEVVTADYNSDDLVWLYDQGSNTIDGPRPFDSSIDPDRYTHWSPCTYPSTKAIDVDQKVLSQAGGA